MPWLVLGGSIAGTLIVVMGLLGAKAAFQTNRNTATIANYETSLRGWKERAEVQDQKIADQELQLERRDEQLEQFRQTAEEQNRSCRASLDELQAKYDTIKEILQGAPQLEALTRILREYESAAFRLEEVIGRFEVVEHMQLGGPIQTDRPDQGDPDASRPA